MENLIITWAGLTVLFWLILSDFINRAADSRIDYDRAASLYRGTFGSTYKRWFIKSRRKFCFAVLKIVFAGLGFLVFSFLSVYSLITLLITL